MRKYSDRFVLHKMGINRISAGAACPFPGKYPLRLLYTAKGEVKYHGKFHAAAWRECVKQMDGSTVYHIYDKAGAVLWGTNTSRINSTSTLIAYRYFARISATSDMLAGVRIEPVGTYKVYLNESAYPPAPLNRSQFVHYVNSNVPHLRTI